MGYLARWRVELGAQELLETQDAVSEIAARSGYTTPSAFDRAFRRRFGVAPGEYRRREGGGGRRVPRRERDR